MCHTIALAFGVGDVRDIHKLQIEVAWPRLIEFWTRMQEWIGERSPLANSVKIRRNRAVVARLSGIHK
jgi:hypothetical protein